MAARSDLTATAFEKGWVLAQVLGEGSFGEVRLLVHPESGQEVAVKMIDLSKDTTGCTKREIMILRMLKHENVISYIGQKCDGTMQFIFLEYVSGGELFDRIEPDIGMPEEQAQNYFRQLICGVEYLHSIGVAHRDLKPENCLLTDYDVLKISDFGLATVFRHKGEERLMNKRCGTLPYVAPEVLEKDFYNATPADIWSCGITLLAMLTGELPWDSARSECESFIDWKECRAWRQMPWTKVHNVALSLLRSMLNCQPTKRATIDRIKAHQWFIKDFSKKTEKRTRASAKRQCLKVEKYDGDHLTSLSQPEASLVSPRKNAVISPPAATKSASPGGAGLARSSTIKDILIPLAPVDVSMFSFSQPADMENLLISTQSQPSQQSQQNTLQKLVKRMTRFVVCMPPADTLSKVELACVGALKFTVKYTTPGQLTISTIDCRRTPLVFKATAFGIQSKTLLDFRLSKGDGLEFKRIFVRIRELLVDIIDNETLNSWAINAHEIHF